MIIKNIFKSFLILLMLSGCEPVNGVAYTSERSDPVAPLPVSSTPETCSMPEYEVHFSPHGGCQEMVVRLINNAKSEILVQAYSFTAKPIGDALVAAKTRGVKVQILLDKSDPTEKNSLVPMMQANKVPYWIDSKHPIAHNKVVIVDKELVETGSYNYTGNAELNGENCLTIHNSELAAKYIDNWNQHREHSK